MDRNPGDVERTDYIKPYAIVKLGDKVATVIANGYNSNSAEEKLQAVVQIAALNDEELSPPAKIKFIGDISTRPKKERIKIAAKLFLLLSSPQTEEKYISKD